MQNTQLVWDDCWFQTMFVVIFLVIIWIPLTTKKTSYSLSKWRFSSSSNGRKGSCAIMLTIEYGMVKNSRVPNPNIFFNICHLVLVFRSTSSHLLLKYTCTIKKSNWIRPTRFNRNCESLYLHPLKCPPNIKQYLVGPPSHVYWCRIVSYGNSNI